MSKKRGVFENPNTKFSRRTKFSDTKFSMFLLQSAVQLSAHPYKLHATRVPRYSQQLFSSTKLVSHAWCISKPKVNPSVDINFRSRRFYDIVTIQSEMLCVMMCVKPPSNCHVQKWCDSKALCWSDLHFLISIDSHAQYASPCCRSAYNWVSI